MTATDAAGNVSTKVTTFKVAGRKRRSKRRTGIEPASSPWKGEALPLSYRRAKEPAAPRSFGDGDSLHK